MHPYKDYPPQCVSPYDVSVFAPINHNGFRSSYLDDEKLYYWTPGCGYRRCNYRYETYNKEHSDIVSWDEYCGDLFSYLALLEGEDSTFVEYANNILSPVDVIMESVAIVTHSEGCSINEKKISFISEFVSEELVERLTVLNKYYPGIISILVNIFYLHTIALDSPEPENVLYYELSRHNIHNHVADEIVSLFSYINTRLIRWKLNLSSNPNVDLIRSITFDSETCRSYPIEVDPSKKRVFDYFIREIQRRKVQEGTQAVKPPLITAPISVSDKRFSRFMERAVFLVLTGHYDKYGYDDFIYLNSRQSFGVNHSVFNEALRNGYFSPPIPHEIKTLAGLIKYIQLVVLTAEYEDKIGFKMDFDSLEFGSFSQLYSQVIEFVRDRTLKAQEELFAKYGFYLFPDIRHIEQYSQEVIGLGRDQYSALCEYIYQFKDIVRRTRIFKNELFFNGTIDRHPFSRLLNQIKDDLIACGKVVLRPFEAFANQEDLVEYLVKRIKEKGIVSPNDIPGQHTIEFRLLFLFSNEQLKQLETQFKISWNEIIHEACCIAYEDYEYCYRFYYENVRTEDDLVEKVLSVLPDNFKVSASFSLNEHLPLFTKGSRGFGLYRTYQSREFRKYLKSLGTTFENLKRAVIRRINI